MGTDATIDPSKPPGGGTVVGHGTQAYQADPEQKTADLPPVTGHDATVAPQGTPPIKTPTIRAGQRDYTELQTIERAHYVMGQEIARGGMGRILVARDRRLGREVAIKELLVDTGDLKVRFEREARITAQLQHPAIVNILEAGVWSTGEPFYVMKLVAGKSLEKAIAERDTFAGRLELLPHAMTVVDALAYAHSKKVIHRDLKPANVLVGDFGETVVIDWGLAKDLDAKTIDTPLPDAYRPPATEAHTVAGSIMGTPAYMPAEQATGGDVDERSDVYALGAIVYHLLTGRPPYTGKTTDAIIAAVLKGPPRPVAEIVPDCPPDLIAIVDKAMAAKPEARYATAGQLADDLRRFQTGQLVGAHRYTTRQRLRRFARRYRVPLAVAAVAFALLAVGGALSVTNIVHERDAAEAARGEAIKQAAIADEHRKRADTQRAAAEDLVGFMLGDLKPKVARLGRLELMSGVSKHVDDYYSKVTELGALDAAATERRAQALALLGDTLDNSGDLPGARRQLEAAIALANTPITRAQAELTLVLVLQETGDPAGALALIAKSRAALEAAPHSPEIELALGKLDLQNGIVLAGEGKNADADALYTHAIERDVAASAQRPKDRDVRAQLAHVYDRRSDVRAAQGSIDAGFADARASLAIRQELLREDPGDISVQVSLASSWGKLYNLAMSANRTDDAKKASAEEVAATEALARIDPSNTQWSRMLLVAYEEAAQLRYELDDFAGAAALVDKPVAIAQARLEREPDSAEALETLGDVLAHQADYNVFANKPDRALEAANKSVAVFEQLHARVPANTDYYNGLGIGHERAGDAYAKVNNVKMAADEYSARVAVEKDLLAAQPANVRTQINLCWAEIKAGRAIAMVPGRYDEGLAMMRAAIATMNDLQKAGTLTPEGHDMIPEFEHELQLAIAKAPYT